MRSAEAQPNETEKLEQVNRCRRTLTEKGKERMVSKEKWVPNIQVPDRNHQFQAGQEDLEHQGCHPKSKLYTKS